MREFSVEPCQISDSEDTDKPEEGEDNYWQINDRGFDARRSFNNDALADITVKYGGNEIKAHRIILSVCSKRFRRLLTSGDQRKISVIELDDDEQAVEDMLRWLYSYSYFEDDYIKYGSHEDILGRMLGSAIIANKYGVSDMELEAVCFCQQFMEFNSHKVDIMKVAKQATRYPDAKRHFASFIPMLCVGRFVELFAHEDVRAWLAKYPSVKATLIDDNFSELIKTEAFREYLQTDGETALRHIDRLMAREQGDDDDRETKRRKVSSSCPDCRSRPRNMG